MAWFTTIHGDSADQPPFRRHKPWSVRRFRDAEVDRLSSEDFRRMLEVANERNGDVPRESEGSV